MTQRTGGAVADDARVVTIDGNEAAASVAFRASEVIAIYPITPASPMGELSDEWATHGRTNVWGTVPSIVEMQSEGGAAGAVHGALQAGALTTTFTASQGLLLMLPNLFKIAGELNAFCMHVAARTVATHALSIFGDHSDVMACRTAGFAMLASASPQQAHDMACIAHAATLAARVPFMHFFDGFRTSHELSPVHPIDDATLRDMLDPGHIDAHRARALSPDHPVVRGTAQNPDTFFQAREACNPFYAACPEIVETHMRRFADRTGRSYNLFDYYGDPEAEDVIVAMGSATETLRETVTHLAARGERVGGLAVRLYRPFSCRHFVAALPASVKRMAVLDRTKEPGALGEPLYLDVLAALAEQWEGAAPRLSAGRYGLSGKELTPRMLAAVFDDLASRAPKRHFTVGIRDDVTHLDLAPSSARSDLEVLPEDTFQALFYGLGADGTVGANKNTIKIVAEHTDFVPQGYFVYDSRKSGAVTVSHLRFAHRSLGAPYLIEAADLVACHQFDLLDRMDVVERVKPGGTLLLNAPFPADEVFGHLSAEVQRHIIDKALTVYTVDAHAVAMDAGLRGRINTVMQVCFFAVSELLPVARAIEHTKHALESTYGKKGSEVVRRNMLAVDRAVAGLAQVQVPSTPGAGARKRPPAVTEGAPARVQRVTAMMLAGHGDRLPVSAFPPDGTWPTATSQWEKRNIALELPVWDPDICIQCNKCTLLCPHAAIRAKAYPDSALAGAPQGFLSTAFRSTDLPGMRYSLQVAPEDCTGCQLCVEVCPAKDKANPRHKALDMHPQRPRRQAERERYGFFLSLPETGREAVREDVKHTQLLQPLFEYSGACAGCGETPYIKLLTQLFGDRLLIANATGCSSIYGGNLPTTPYAINREGRGPAWSNSLFEDNAEFGLGMKLAVDALRARAQGLAARLSDRLDRGLVEALMIEGQGDNGHVEAQRQRVADLKRALRELADKGDQEAHRLSLLADYLTDKSIWLVGGDGWAYDIGFGGLDHVLASGQNVNILVLDTEVYSNTGGQQSKATPLGAAAKFAAAGKAVPKKDLGLIAMAYDHVYVAQVAMGARDKQTLTAFIEAERHPGPSLIIAYSHCIAHGYDLMHGARQQKLAVESGIWPLYRFDPARVDRGEPPLHLDGGTPRRHVRDYMQHEARFRMVERLDPKRFEALQSAAQAHARRRTEHYRQLAELRVAPQDTANEPPKET
ncbi:MAG: pyruvate:ferredoxin (flavodoxin) oxidoreductase [Myxococcales bacterium]|nr:pyruvate:ferredoxin (flavodoxin) oxidoreductase [Myxococcales bacterium]